MFRRFQFFGANFAASAVPQFIRRSGPRRPHRTGAPAGTTMAPGIVPRAIVEAGLPLGVLRGLPSLLESRLLPFGRPCITGEEAGLLQGRAVVVPVDLVQRTSDRQAQGTGLTGVAAAVDAGDDVEAVFDVEENERGVHQLLVHLVREVVLQRAAVDLPVPSAGDEAHAGNSFLPAANAGAGSGEGFAAARGRSGFRCVGAWGVLKLVDVGGGFSHGFMLLFGPAGAYCATWVISKVFGCCAACGCSAPA